MLKKSVPNKKVSRTRKSKTPGTERMNTTLKDEFSQGTIITTKQQAYQLAVEAVELYNHRIPHLRLDMKTSNKVH